MIEFLASNWLWITAVVLFVLMHRGGHGCGMHGGHRHHHEHQSGHEAGDDGPVQAPPRDASTTRHAEHGVGPSAAQRGEQ